MPDSAIEHELSVGLAITSLVPSAPRCLGAAKVSEKRAIRYERLEGRVLTECQVADPAALDRHARHMAEAQWAIHRCAAGNLAPVKQALERAIGHQTALGPEETAAVLGRLGELPEGQSLCHGDFHPMNIMVGDQVRVIDWMNAAKGPPESDVARSLVILSYARDESFKPSLLAHWLSEAYLSLFVKRYLAHWVGLAGGKAVERRSLVRAWLLPHAAARLDENPSLRETAALMKLIRRELRLGGKVHG
jgi:Ser/Thr protein kinase RdoA (MazF antagonist)